MLKEYRKSGGAPVCYSAFCWGAQGPDFLFYGWPLRKKQNLAVLGSRMHKGDPAPLFAAMRAYCAEHAGDDAVRSYVLGFLCHYSLDRTVHPYVYAGIRELKKIYPERPGLFLHSQIETALDNITLRFESGGLPTSFDLKRTVPRDPEAQRRIAALYGYLLRALSREPVEPAALLGAMRNCRFVCGLQNDRTGCKKEFFGGAERRFGRYWVSCFFHGLTEDDDYDYANVSGTPSSDPKPRRETYLDLYLRSAAESLDFISRFFSVGSFDPYTDHIPFS